ncbi:MAG: hypothetical protein CMA16_05475 [Euryarchaeota archaeon]|nr:hypothetical protein [Euryarchaeota archaeon]
MSDENQEVAMAECGSCRAIVPVDSTECPECGVSFSGVSDEALGECGNCNSLVPLDSTKCPECGVVFVADDVVDILRTWMADNKMDVKTLFGRFDTNKDNMIDSGELKQGLLSLNLADLPPSQVERLVEAIDEDGDSLIDLEELQTIIGGDNLDEEDTTDQTQIDEESKLDYNENVLSKVMEKNQIDTSEKEAFLVFAKDYNVDDNQYLKKEELQAAAEGWIAQKAQENEVQDDESVADDSATEDEMAEDEDEEETEGQESEDVEAEESTVEETEDVESDDVETEVEETVGVVDDVEDSVMEDVDSEDATDELEEDQEDDDARFDRTTAEIMEQLLDVIDEQDKSLSNAFGDLDDDGNRLITGQELVSKLNEILPDGLSQTEADALLDSMDTDGDGNIDMVEFVTAIEQHEDEIVTIEDEEAETIKTFPSEWQSRFMSKKWHDVIWPLIHASFAFLIVGLLVNGLFPLVDGTGGPVELEMRSDSLNTEIELSDGSIVGEGDIYPCDPEFQEGECKNSLTPLAGKASSMPGGFYWDAIALMALAGVGLIWSLYTHLVRAPGWRARVKAMKEVDDERAEVQESLVIEEEESDEETQDESDEDESDQDESDDMVDGESDDIGDENSEEEFDIGSYVGLEIDGDDYYGIIIEFDDGEGTVVIEEDETGDEIVGYQDEMFIPEE